MKSGRGALRLLLQPQLAGSMSPHGERGEGCAGGRRSPALKLLGERPAVVLHFQNPRDSSSLAFWYSESNSRHFELFGVAGLGVMLVGEGAADDEVAL